MTRAQHPALPDDSHVDHNAPPASPSLLVVLTHPGAQLPAYKTDEAAGLDLAACLGDGEVLTLAPLERRLVPTGLRPRSGWALKDGVTVLNSPGTIDSDYRGEIAILLINLSAQPVQIRHGDRVAQLVVTPVARVSPVEVTKLDDTDRGAGGFGHTGRS